jgi:diacylglycerol kinase family enzyme
MSTSDLRTAPYARTPGARGGGQVVVVAHPETVDLAELRRRAGEVASAHGLDLLRVDSTTPEDPGTDVARSAIADGCSLVVCCGGDGTVRAVAAALAGTGVALGIVPTGTGNLLARNLGLPAELPDALEVAIGGQDRRLDCGRIGDEVFLIMAGMGLDAAMVGDAPPGLKKVLGWPAYVVSGARHLLDPSMRLRYRLDGGAWQHGRARSVVIGNVGALQAGVTLFPDADPSDGLLEVALLSPRSPREWGRLGVRLMRGSRGDVAHLQRHRFRELELEAQQEQAHELDGDVVGRVRSLSVAVDPGALTVRVPR